MWKFPYVLHMLCIYEIYTWAQVDDDEVLRDQPHLCLAEMNLLYSDHDHNDTHCIFSMTIRRPSSPRFHRDLRMRWRTRASASLLWHMVQWMFAFRNLTAWYPGSYDIPTCHLLKKRTVHSTVKVSSCSSLFLVCACLRVRVHTCTYVCLCMSAQVHIYKYITCAYRGKKATIF